MENYHSTPSKIVIVQNFSCFEIVTILKNINENENSLVLSCYLKWSLEFDHGKKNWKENEGVSFKVEFIKQKVYGLEVKR